MYLFLGSINGSFVSIIKNSNHIVLTNTTLMKKNISGQCAKGLLLGWLVFWSVYAGAQSNPGGISGASVWLRADQGVTAAGTNISAWTNQVVGANFTGNGNPQLAAANVNFNPAVTFSGSNYLTSATNVLPANSPYTKFVVFKYDGATANNIISSGPGGNNAFFGANTSTDLAIFHAGTILTVANAVNSTRYFLSTAGFSSGTAAGTFINVDGTVKASMNSSAAYAASTMQLGAHGNGNNLTGRIAEVIVYPSAMASSATSTRQVESYLGIKYGITLSHDYLASDGTVTFGVGSFGTNIAGIGRDDNSALDQKQSRSINTGSQVVMALGSVATTNAGNANTFAADGQFLVWGDNNGSITATTALSGWTTTTARLNRIWQLRNTGSFAQQVTVYFPTSGLNVLPGTSPYLIYNTSSTLAGGGTEVAASTTATIGGIAHTGFTVMFPSTGTLYFSFAARTIDPGNVPGAAVWVRADAGISATGNNVTGWINQVNAANSFTGTGNPQLSAANVNFNPGITFSGSNYLTSTANVLPVNSPYTKFVVFKYDAVSNNNLVSSGPGGGQAFFSNGTATDLALWHSGVILNAVASVTTARYYLGTGGFTRNLAAGTYINVDGVSKGSTNSASTYATSALQLGAHTGTSNLTGRMAEVIVFPSSLGAASTATRQIESYLGLKYGITIGHHYLASDGTTVSYDTTGFARNIAGIGRDDNTALYQKQGRSLNAGGQVIMALGSAAASNAANSSLIATDKQFMVWGDNNGSIAATTTLSGWTTTTTRLNRIWKLQNTGALNQQVTVYFPTANLNALPGTSPYLIYNTSNTLAGGGTEVPASITTTIGGVACKGFVVTFPTTGTLYFGFASKAVNPGNIAGAAVWLRPDAGVNTTGTNVTSWINQVNAANSFTGTANPQLTAGQINFNAAVTFSGTNYLTSASTVLPANSPYTKFVVFKYDGSTNYNIVSSGPGGNNAFLTLGATAAPAIWHSGTILSAPGSVSNTRYYLSTGGFQSGVAGGTFINVDGTTEASMNATTGYVASTMQLGAHNSTPSLDGGIAEVIVYPSALGSATTATRQIESYLGLKYGITLSHDYLASDGTTTTYSVATHGFNIAGIGRDDDEGLNQVQSLSINPGTSQVVIALGSVAATNDANTNTFAGDKQFLVWGSDNGSIATTAAVTGFTTVNNRLSRIWKLQNTGSFNQQVTVYFPTSSLNQLTNATKYLIYNTSATLTGPGTEVAGTTTATIGGVAYTGFAVTFPTTGTLYFSFGSKAVNPGDVSGAAVWVRADAGVNTTGTAVTTWVNQMNIANNFAATGNPQLTPAFVNFNPTVSFDGSDYLTSVSNVPSTTNGNYTKLVVFRSVSGTNLLSSLTNTGTAMYTSVQALRMLHNGAAVGATANGTINPGRQYLGTQVFNSGVANGTLIRINGITNVAVTSSAAHTANRLQIGAYVNSNFLEAGGNIAEVVVYNSALSAANYRRVESYLALKYGLTLGSDYLASDGSTTYTVSGYGSNIAGIGRDDNTALDQRQGQSVNPGSQVVIASGDAAFSNAANDDPIAADKQFLIWGDNDVPGYNYNVGISQKRLATTWQLQNSNAFNQVVTVYYPVTGLYGLGNAPRLIYGSLASLDDGSATQVAVGSYVLINGEEYRSFSLTFPTTATLYFSFAGEIIPEICGNGIDDDLDEYIDELDAGCTPIPTCIAVAPPLTSFGIKQDWVTSTANALATSVSPTVADLDGDGIPEILAVRAGGTGLTYFKGNGSNASKNSIDYNIQLPVRVGQSTMQPAVADVDRDGLPEVMVVGDDGYVYVFNNISGSSSVYKYRSAEVVSARFGNGSPRVVDINEDGVPEIVVGLDVFQFNFGEGRLVKAVTGSATAPCGMDGVAAEWGNDLVVIDILSSNPGKELVAGSQVYGVNLTTGVTTVLANLSTIAGTALIPANNDGPTAVADLDNDGDLDIAYPNGTHLVAWDPTSATLLLRLPYVNNGIMYRGMPAIANVYDEQTIDGAASNLPEVIFTSNLRLHAFNLNKTTGPVWSLVTTDGSGETGVTAFDLNGDGVQEIIYNDEDNIRVITGNAAVPTNAAIFASGTATWMEHPVVADVDNDGSAEFACVTNGAVAFTGMLRVFGPANGTSPWQATRKLWNGRGYRPKSVIDDLTIPVKEQNISLQYPPASGKYPLDVFNCQIDARLLSPGIAPVSDLTISNLEIANSGVSCSFVPAAAALSYTLSNNGAAAAPAGTPLRFYKGDPTVGGSVLLVAKDSLAGNLVVGASVTDTVILNLSAHTPPYTIYAVINDNGTDPVPVTLPVTSTNVKECDYTNNTASVPVNPLPADLGNLSGTWPAAAAGMPASDAAWLGINVPNAECAVNVNDGTEGLVITSGSAGGTGTSASPWLVGGVNTVCNFTLTVNGNGTPKPVYWGIWYDADANGSFTDATDTFATGNLTHGSPVSTTLSLTVPNAIGATNGVIRVVASAVDPLFSKSMNGTGEFANGEVEDYFITYSAPLPVTLGSFSAVPAGGCAAHIGWSTGNEEHSDRYEIQRSSDGHEFVTIGSVKSRNRTAGSTYNYTDDNARNGSNYYRLKLVDIDGRNQYSRTAAVHLECGHERITLVPNPVNSVATVTGLRAGDVIRVMSSDGRVESELKADKGTVQLHMGALPGGVHLIQVLRDNEVVDHIKVTKL